MVISKRRFGVELEHGGQRPVAQKANVLAFGSAASNLGHDGSGIELRTPPLQGEAGFTKLRTCMDYLVEHGQWVSQSDGMHVHFETVDYHGKNKACADLVHTWLNIYPLLSKLVSPSRLVRAPLWWERNHVKSILEGKSVPGFYSRHGLNFSSTLTKTLTGMYGGRKYETTEIRLHEGCLDADVAIPWIMLMQGMFDFVINEETYVRPHKHVATLSKRLGLDGEPAELLIKRSMTPGGIKDLPSRSNWSY